MCPKMTTSRSPHEPSRADDAANADGIDLVRMSEAIAQQIRAYLTDSRPEGAQSEETDSAKTSAPQNRRESFRCQLTGPRAKGVFRSGDQRFEAEALDESAHGFSILIDGQPALELGQTALLKIASSWSEVCIISVFRQPADSDSTSPPKTRLGLLRIKDVDEPADEAEATSTLALANVRFAFHAFVPLAKHAAGVVVILALVVIVAFSLDWVLSDPSRFTNTRFAAVHPGHPNRTRIVHPAKNPDPAAAVPESALPTRVAEPTPGHASGQPKRSPSKQSLAARPSVLLHPRAIERLGLSAQQLNRLHNVLDDGGDVIDRELVSRLEAESTTAPTTATERTAQQALNVLSGEQKAAMRELLREPEFKSRVR